MSVTPIYSGGTIVNDTHAGDATKQGIANWIEASLLAAGWTTVSGSGTDDLLMQSATTPVGEGGMAMRARIRGDLTNTVTCRLKKTDNTLETAAFGHLLPDAGREYRINAHKYGFTIACITPTQFTANRSFMWAQLPSLPAFEVPDANLRACGGGIALSDTDASFHTSFRNQPNFSNGGVCVKIGNGQIMSIGNTGAGADIGGVQFEILEPSVGSGGRTTLRWNSADRYAMITPVIAFSPDGSGLTRARKQGYHYNALILLKPSVAAEQTFSYDGRTWRSWSDSDVTGCLLLAET